MRKWFISTLVIGIFMFLISSIVFAQGLSGVITADYVNIRSKPSIDAPVIGTLNSGDIIGFFNIYTDYAGNKWTSVHVVRTGQNGYVAMQYVAEASKPAPDYNLTLDGISMDDSFYHLVDIYGQATKANYVDDNTTQYFYNDMVVTTKNPPGKLWIETIRVLSPAYATDRGVRVGDNLDTLVKAYDVKGTYRGTTTNWLYISPQKPYYFIFVTDNQTRKIVEIILGNSAD